MSRRWSKRKLDENLREEKAAREKAQTALSDLRYAVDDVVDQYLRFEQEGKSLSFPWAVQRLCAARRKS